VVFFLFMLLHQTDKLMIGSMQTPISATFNLNDLQWGLINSGGLIVATLLYPVWGFYAIGMRAQSCCLWRL
jgi:hypothetical protein